MDKRWFVLVGILVIVGVFTVMSFRSGNVVLNYEEDYSQGDKLSGDLTIGIEAGDSLEASMPILISLSKDGKIIASDTLTLEEFLKLSGAGIEKVKKEKGDFYETPGFYSLPISRVINYTFTENGKYELMFVLLKLDITKITTINVA